MSIMSILVAGGGESVPVPGAPTIGTAYAGDTRGAVYFTPPAVGAPITLYTATASPGGATGTNTASPVIITGLSNGTTYTFTVTATNAGGTGPASAASNSAVPNPPPSGTITLLIIAGGGSGGTNIGAGGGAGGYRDMTTFGAASGSPFSITVGASDSLTQFIGSTFRSAAGGFGGCEGPPFGSGPVIGGSGGSGGGGGTNLNGSGAGGTGNVPATTPLQGRNGGAGITNRNTYRYGGGGGGHATVGGAAITTRGGNGGTGTASSITGTSLVYSAGGGGGAGFNRTAGTGGSSGVGGNGAGGDYSPGDPGMANRGGGGGGGAFGGGGGAGGSGIFIMSYADAGTGQLVIIDPGLTFTYAVTGGNKVYRFTGGTGNVQW